MKSKAKASKGIILSSHSSPFMEEKADKVSDEVLI